MDRVHGALRRPALAALQQPAGRARALSLSQRGYGPSLSLSLSPPPFERRHPRWPSAGGRHDGGGGAEAAQGAAGARAQAVGGRALRRLLPPRRLRRQQVSSPTPPQIRRPFRRSPRAPPVPRYSGLAFTNPSSSLLIGERKIGRAHV